jgi:group I intron endonuclease
MLASRYTGCVYLATNTVNGRCYVGKTIMALCDRKAIHVHAARRKASTSAFHAAIRKYGAGAFEWCKLFESDDEALLFEAERGLIADYRTTGNRLYNIGGGGEGQSMPCTPERRAKLSAAFKGRPRWNAEQRKQMSERQKGKPRNPESIEKMRRTKTGKKLAPWSDERRAKLRATWAIKFAAGYEMSEDAKAAMSRAGKERAKDPAERRRLSEIAKKGAKARWG